MSRNPTNGTSFLYLIKIYSGDVSTAKQIVESGAQIDRTSKQGMTPLCMAVAGGHTEVVKLLLDSNADPNMTGPLAGSGDPGK